jgi:GxxExxY protein
MSTDKNYLHSDITESIIGCFYNVYNKLGFGFLEKVYENALLVELHEAGMIVESQVPIQVYYKNKKVGNYFADLLVDEKVIIELKAGDGAIIEEHELQLINYLRATEIEVGLLLCIRQKTTV